MASKGGDDNKFKQEVYQNLSGTNTKIDPYALASNEFMDLSNFDFQSPGSLSQRWGTTLYQSQNFSGPITALYEYVKLDGTSGLMTGVSGGLWYGATTGQAQGLSMTYQGITFTARSFFGTVNTGGGAGFLRLGQPVYFEGDRNKTLNIGNPNKAQVGTGVSFGVASQVLAQNKMDFVTFQNYLFMGDGNVFLKFDGSTTSPVGLPPAIWGGTGTVAFSGATDAVGIAGSTTTSFAFYSSYVNSRSFEGPIWPLGLFSVELEGATAASLGGTIGVFTIQMHTPLQYDISAINLYCYAGTSLSMGLTFWNLPYKFVSQTPASGSTITNVVLGAGIGVGQSNMCGNLGTAPPLNTYYQPGFTLQIGSGASVGLVTQVDTFNFAPRFLESHQNRLFLAGFSTAASTVFFSAIDESNVPQPEGYDPSFNLEVRTNDGDRITALKSYNSRMYVFKQFSFHELSGDNPDNFFLREVSNQYGCLSNRAVEVYNDIMLFLDSKGVMRFDGAGLNCISDKVQPVFDSINLTAALDQATMVNDKSRNEILIGIPTNGATVNNTTVVYDYLMNAWTKYDGYNPAIYASIKQRFGIKTVLFGGYSGQVMNFGPSLMGDNGAGFTCYLKTSFQAQLGQSNEKLYRRTWFNFDEVTGATVPININYYQDYGASIVLNRTVYLSPFQSRIDFGIPAKSLAFELSKFSATTMIKFHGYAHAYRFQRGV